MATVKYAFILHMQTFCKQPAVGTSRVMIKSSYRYYRTSSVGMVLWPLVSFQPSACKQINIVYGGRRHSFVCFMTLMLMLMTLMTLINSKTFSQSQSTQNQMYT